MPLDSFTLKHLFHLLMCTNIRACTEGRECACCVFDSRGQCVSKRNPPYWVQAKQGQDNDRVQAVSQGEWLIYSLFMCKN